MKEFGVHPDEIKALGVGRAYLIQGDGTRSIIRVHHRPATGGAPFDPTFPRKWASGDRERCGQGTPALDLAEQLAAVV